MTLELLFAQAGQCRTFLLTVLLGAGMALWVQLSGCLHRVRPWLGMAADLAGAAALAVAVGRLMLLGGESLRLYALLGLMIGGALYAAGAAPALRRLCKIFSRPKAGTSPPPAE